MAAPARYEVNVSRSIYGSVPTTMTKDPPATYRHATSTSVILSNHCMDRGRIPKSVEIACQADLRS